MDWSITGGLIAVALSNAIPHIVTVWRKRSESELQLLHETRDDVKKLRKELALAEHRIDELETAKRLAEDTVSLKSLELERAEVELVYWKKLAETNGRELVELYNAVTGGHTVVTLPPPPMPPRERP